VLSHIEYYAFPQKTRPGKNISNYLIHPHQKGIWAKAMATVVGSQAESTKEASLQQLRREKENKWQPSGVSRHLKPSDNG